MSEEWIAHVRKKPDDTWDAPQGLAEHLGGTAELAEQFAAQFGSGAWGRAAGLAHDAGKGRREWQQYLGRKSGYYDEAAHLEGQRAKVSHAIYGAKLVEEVFGKGVGRPLAYVIAGHHAGLPDWSNAEGTGTAALQFQQDHADTRDVAGFVVQGLKAGRPGPMPWLFDKGLDCSLWIRMLYSCLVDADFLDTEAYMEAARAEERGGYCGMAELLERLNGYVRQLEEGAVDTPVNRIRRQVRQRCAAMAAEPQGVFSLSVPTGGGKTLSSLTFALEHAKKYQLDRVIYVIPYTSIIEQNAEVFAAALGKEQVVEHHSSLVEEEYSSRARLAAENWDAPVIVTTSVQFFESLFAAKSSRCRKLHNLVHSVIVLDEAQLLPVEYLTPVLAALNLLVEHYGVTLVLSTATQPALRERMVGETKFPGFTTVREIMGDTLAELYAALKRTQVCLPADFRSVAEWGELAQELTQYEQVLCIVSDRKSCRELHACMPKETIHLSALMCGEHRSVIIKKIKEKLQSGEPVQVISTQLVEAGVDIDFPVVYRSLAGLDSIAQAAGRCNREGKRNELGKVVVFLPPRPAPPGLLRKAADTTRALLTASRQDPLDQALFEPYFSELYGKANSLDAKDMLGLLTPTKQDLGIAFRTAAERFTLIDDSRQCTVLVRYGEGSRWIDTLRFQGPTRTLLRRLQRYAVTIAKETCYELVTRGVIEQLPSGIFVLVSADDYDDAVGLLLDGKQYEAEALII